MKKLARLAREHADNIDLCRESQKKLSDFIVDLLDPVIPNLSSVCLSSMQPVDLFFLSDSEYLDYSEERKIMLGDVLSDFMPNVAVDEFGDLWITEEEMYKVYRILEEAL